MALPWAAMTCAFSALDPGSVGAHSFTHADMVCALRALDRESIGAIASRIAMGCRGPTVCGLLSPRAPRLRVKTIRSPTSAFYLQIDPKDDCGLEARATLLSLLCSAASRENHPAAFCEGRPQGMTKHAPPVHKLGFALRFSPPRAPRLRLLAGRSVVQCGRISRILKGIASNSVQRYRAINPPAPASRVNPASMRSG